MAPTSVCVLTSMIRVPSMSRAQSVERVLLESLFEARRLYLVVVSVSVPFPLMVWITVNDMKTRSIKQISVVGRMT